MKPENKHHIRVEALRWRIVRHDGTTLAGYSREEDARAALAVFVRPDMPQGYAHVQAPRGAR